MAPGALATEGLNLRGAAAARNATDRSSVLGNVSALARSGAGLGDGNCEPCCIHSGCGEAGWYDDGACGAAWYCTDDQWSFDMGDLDNCCIDPSLGSPTHEDEGCNWPKYAGFDMVQGKWVCALPCAIESGCWTDNNPTWEQHPDRGYEWHCPGNSDPDMSNLDPCAIEFGCSSKYPPVYNHDVGEWVCGWDQ